MSDLSSLGRSGAIAKPSQAKKKKKKKKGKKNFEIRKE